ncbi:rRNA adenine N-6-methyltransferase family protein [bacterium]|nr:rRNA adenine N-6-methyltransferase family protein [bacterium]
MEDHWGYNKKLHTFRYEILFKSIDPQIYENQKVLELGPFMGWFSEQLNKRTLQLDLVELHPKAIEGLQELFVQEISDKKVNLFEADIHHKIYQLEPIYNFISCCGFLYHSPHPFWVMEGMAKLNPQYILIDNYCGDQSVYLKDAGAINQYGMRQSRQSTVPYNLVLSKEVIMQSMKHLGYSVYAEVDKSMYNAEHLSLPAHYTEMFDFWKKNSSSIWFKKST